MIDLRRYNIEAGMKQWMGCIYAGQRRVHVASGALLRMRGVLVDMLPGRQEMLSCRLVANKR